MTTWIALLRAVNVGGRNSVPMADARSVFEKLGLLDVRTLLQSGNVVFRHPAKPSADGLEASLEEATAKRFKFAVDIMVRTAAEWNDVVARNPFKEEARKDPGRLVLMCLKRPAVPADAKALQAGVVGAEVIRAAGKALYITYPNGMGTSKLTNVVIEKKLGTRGTARNWNTVLKLQREVELLA